MPVEPWGARLFSGRERLLEARRCASGMVRVSSLEVANGVAVVVTWRRASPAPTLGAADDPLLVCSRAAGGNGRPIWDDRSDLGVRAGSRWNSGEDGLLAEVDV